MRAPEEAPDASSRVVEAPEISALLDAILESGYRLLGPTVKDGAIVYDEIASASALPAGIGQEQTNGRYRLRTRVDDALFGYTVGPHAWKKFLFPASLRLFSATRRKKTLQLRPEEGDPRPDAFLGVRPCDLAAIARQDRVFLAAPFPTPRIAPAASGALRRRPVQRGRGHVLLLLAGTGPRAAAGFDLAFTELLDGARHDFLVEAGTDRGAALVAKIPSRRADPADLEAARAATRRAEAGMGRTLDVPGLKDLLGASAESPRWDEVAESCLSCANCTMVCPTCFCTTVEDVIDLTAPQAERWRRWDSCSHARLRLHPWRQHPPGRALALPPVVHAQVCHLGRPFGEPGCVGCGRCITWCPAGIDLTEEARALAGQASPRRPPDGGTTMEGPSTPCWPNIPFFAEAQTPRTSEPRRLRQERAFRGGRVSVPRGRRGGSVLRDPSRKVAVEIGAPPRGVVTIQTDRRARSSAGPGSSRRTGGGSSASAPS